MKKLLIVLLVLGLVSPVMAAEWNFYGSARMATFYLTQDTGDLEDANVQYDDADFSHGLQGNARIGATVKTSDQIGGAFEYGSTPNLRKLYGTWNFGGGELLVGQTYTPTSSYFYSNSVYDADGDLLGLGQFYAGRRPMVQLKINTFKIALVDPSPGVGSLGAYDDADVTLPKFELSYGFKSDTFFIDVYGGYLTYDLQQQAAGVDESVTVTAYTVGIGGGMMFGPATISLGANMGQNYGAYGAYQGFTSRAAGGLSLANADEPILVGDDVEDTGAMQALLVANFKMSDTFSLEAGVGYAKWSNSDGYESILGAGADDDIVKMQYYVNAVVTFAPGFFIVPEIGMIDYGDAPDGDTDLGSDTYVGLKWQINF